MTSPDRFMVQRMGAEEGPFTLAELQAQVRAGSIKSDTHAASRRRGGGSWFRAAEVPGLFSEKEWIVALLLSAFLGTLGDRPLLPGLYRPGHPEAHHLGGLRDLVDHRPDPDRDRQPEGPKGLSFAR